MRRGCSTSVRADARLLQYDDRKWQCAIVFKTSVHRSLRMSPTTGTQIVCQEKGTRVIAAVFRSTGATLQPSDYCSGSTRPELRNRRISLSQLDGLLPSVSSKSWHPLSMARGDGAAAGTVKSKLARGSVGLEMRHASGQ